MESCLAVFDTETTSAQPSTCGVVQCALLINRLQEDGTLQEDFVINELCDPSMEISDGAAEVHGITPEMIQGARFDHDVMFDAYMYLVERQDHMILVGHNLRPFDRPILVRLAHFAAHQRGITLPPLTIRFIDTLVIARRVLHMVPGGHKLGELIEWITQQPVVDAHDAVGDCRSVLTILAYFCGAMEMTIDQLADYCAQTRVLKICTYKKHKGKLWGRGDYKTHVPSNYAMWMANNFEGADPDLKETLRHHYGLRFKKM